MKELTSYNRAAGYLNKIFDLLNARYFENALSRPTITIQSTPKAYGHFSLRDDTWVSKNGASHEMRNGCRIFAVRVSDRDEIFTDCDITSRNGSLLEL